MRASSKFSPPSRRFFLFFFPGWISLLLSSRTMCEPPGLSFTRDLKRRGAAAGMFVEGCNWQRAVAKGWFPLAVLVSDGGFLLPR